MYNRATVAGSADEGEEALAAAPEAATIAWRDATRFIFPDPPLSRDELALLQPLRPDAEFSTGNRRKAAEVLRHLSRSC